VRFGGMACAAEYGQKVERKVLLGLVQCLSGVARWQERGYIRGGSGRLLCLGWCALTPARRSIFCDRPPWSLMTKLPKAVQGPALTHRSLRARDASHLRRLPHHAIEIGRTQSGQALVARACRYRVILYRGHLQRDEIARVARLTRNLGREKRGTACSRGAYS
jgi:hypothetical protein